MPTSAVAALVVAGVLMIAAAVALLEAHRASKPGSNWHTPAHIRRHHKLAAVLGMIAGLTTAFGTSVLGWLEVAVADNLHLETATIAATPFWMIVTGLLIFAVSVLRAVWVFFGPQQR